MQADLPSGLVVGFRNIQGTEFLAIAEQMESSGDSSFFPILNACTTEVIDPGPYSFLSPGEARPDWRRLLKGDVVGGTVFLRRTSAWDAFDFDHPCEQCGTRIPWRVMLSDIEMTRLSETSAHSVRAGQPLSLDFEGTKITYELATFTHEEAVTKMMRSQRRKGSSTIVDNLYGQIRTIDGVAPDPKARFSWIAKLSARQLVELRELIDATDCGMKTMIEIQCTASKCRWIQEVALPLVGKRFFAKPRKGLEVTGPLSSPESSFPGSLESGSGT